MYICSANSVTFTASVNIGDQSLDLRHSSNILSKATVILLVRYDQRNLVIRNVDQMVKIVLKHPGLDIMP